MQKKLPRLLLSLSAVIMAVGGLSHAKAFDKTLAAVAESDLAIFFANSLKALWLIDSATLLTLSVVFGLIAARPNLATRPVIIVLAAIPAATAVLLYAFLGMFIPAHVLLISAIAAIVSGVLW